MDPWNKFSLGRFWGWCDGLFTSTAWLLWGAEVFRPLPALYDDVPDCCFSCCCCCSKGLLTPTSNLRLVDSGRFRLLPSKLWFPLSLESFSLPCGDCCFPLKDQEGKLCGRRLGPGPYFGSDLLEGGGEASLDSAPVVGGEPSRAPVVKLGKSWPKRGERWLSIGPALGLFDLLLLGLLLVLLLVLLLLLILLLLVLLLAAAVLFEAPHVDLEDKDDWSELLVGGLVELAWPPSGLLLVFCSSFSSLLPAVQLPPTPPCPDGTRLIVGSLPLCSAFKLGKFAGARRAVGTFPRLCNPCFWGILFCRGFKAEPCESKYVGQLYDKDFIVKNQWLTWYKVLIFSDWNFLVPFSPLLPVTTDILARFNPHKSELFPIIAQKKRKKKNRQSKLIFWNKF